MPQWLNEQTRKKRLGGLVAFDEDVATLERLGEILQVKKAEVVGNKPATCVVW